MPRTGPCMNEEQAERAIAILAEIADALERIAPPLKVQEETLGSGEQRGDSSPEPTERPT